MREATTKVPAVVVTGSADTDRLLTELSEVYSSLADATIGLSEIKRRAVQLGAGKSGDPPARRLQKEIASLQEQLDEAWKRASIVAMQVVRRARADERKPAPAVKPGPTVKQGDARASR